jgi:hypothetical protein
MRARYHVFRIEPPRVENTYLPMAFDMAAGRTLTARLKLATSASGTFRTCRRWALMSVLRETGPSSNARTPSLIPARGRSMCAN